ncbi:FKBP-type peptidyl-prolyl cis-trans isomerase [Sphingobacterium sp. Mn56C]|uniref:FKBP-type peptidyl-prolyl cis-trans isomerase n=1 Tax=Sphingobacterium sp. Mn56C TaxID=3395261 RepID=UPI003BD9704A
MKTTNLIKTSLVALAGVFLFSACNKKDNTDYEEFYRQQEKSLDSLIFSQRTAIENYAKSTYGTPVKDTVSMRYYYLNKKTDRSIWYEVVNEPTDNTYEYKATLTNGGYVAVLPILKLKYTAKLLNGTVVQEDKTGSTYNWQNNPNTPIFNNLWYYAFTPYDIKINGDAKIIGGITKNGLKKGSKFRIVGPSVFAFQNSTLGDKIPANSPLAYEFEVLEISN